MGNPDLAFVFNKSFGIVVKGQDYEKEPNAIRIALKQFEEEAKASIAMWYEAKKRDPESVVADYRPEGELEIRSIESYPLHN